MQKLNNPHDRFFKDSFSRKDVVRNFIQEYIPPDLTKQIDLNSLEIQKDSFIDNELSASFSDILYKINIADESGFLYFLFEHKSFFDKWTTFQILRYEIKIWELFRKQNPDAEKLPIIIPIIIYHGSKILNDTKFFYSLFVSMENTTQYIPKFDFQLMDLSSIPEYQLRGEILLRVHFLVQKHINDPNLIDKLPEIFDMLSNLSSKNILTEYLEVLLRYLTSTIKKENIIELKQIIDRTFSNTGDNLMTTIAEKWLNDGIEQGIEQGVLKEKINFAKKLLLKGLSDKEILELTDLSMEQLQNLKAGNSKH